MLITAKECEACTNSPSPIRWAPSPLPPPSSSHSLPSHFITNFFSFLNLYNRICSDYFQLEYKDPQNLYFYKGEREESGGWN